MRSTRDILAKISSTVTQGLTLSAVALCAKQEWDGEKYIAGIGFVGYMLGLSMKQLLAAHAQQPELAPENLLLANNINIPAPNNHIHAHINLPNIEAKIVSPSINSVDLDNWIKSHREAKILNSELSQKYKANELGLECPLLLDFPQIPVRFNGHLYDYDALMKTAHNNFIEDPLNRRIIQLAPDIIQPDYDAQKKMDDLLLEMQISNKPSVHQ